MLPSSNPVHTTSSPSSSNSLSCSTSHLDLRNGSAQMNHPSTSCRTLQAECALLDYYFILGVILGYMGIMEKKMETIILYRVILGFIRPPTAKTLDLLRDRQR